MNPKTTLILGVGNTVLSDEGIGVYVLRRLEMLQATGDPLLAPVELMDGGTLSFELVGPITAAARFIVIDACQLH
ncbi:MAG: hydrogenase maturation protease [Candidatus Contendobacter sp.]|jgi:hydrogenase maturation protease|nr:hydrogenase maturation protease [Candidatus Contendobacter sp.]